MGSHGHDDEGHRHGHGLSGVAATRAGNRYAGRLWMSFALTVGFLVVQLIVGVATHSLALLSDAGHMATDALGVGMALAAISAANRATASHRTFGLYRLEILAALANAVLLFGVAGYVGFEAIQRLRDPHPVTSWPVLLVGVIGLLVNLTSFLLLRRGAKASLNVRGVYVEVISDALGSLGVIAAAAVMWATGSTWIDSVIGAAIGLFILPRAWRLGRDALRVLVQAAPHGIDIDEVRGALHGIDGVTGVHDLHLWTLTSEMHVVTAHLATDGDDRSRQVLDDALVMLAERFGLTHATLQVECLGSTGCSDLDW
jgi:cobalt-zinc-cadmium efflux system protein